jgi:acyl dehydratase
VKSMQTTRPQRYWEDVQEGDELPALHYPLTMLQMVLFVSATQAWSPIHHDREEVRRRGWPDIFPGGMALQSCCSRLLMDYIGEAGWLKRFKIRFRRMNHLGTTMTVRGQVVKKYVQDGEHLLDLELWLETEQYGITAPASATVRLPARGQVVHPVISLR